MARRPLSGPELLPSRRGRVFAVGLALVLGWGCATGGGAPGDGGRSTPRWDHHLHVLSPELLELWRDAGGVFPLGDDSYVRARSILRGAGAQGGYLISMGHALASPSLRREMGLVPGEELRLVRELHDHLAREAIAAGGAVVAHCSVPLLQPWAREELRRCRDDLGIHGVKLHLPVSGVDLRRPEELALVAELAREAAPHGGPFLLHLAPPVGHLTQGEIRAFFRDVVLPNPGLEVTLAHLGGNGGYRPSARRVVAELIRLKEETAVGHPLRVRLELSGVVLPEETMGVPPLSIRDARDLVADLRRVGLERVLFGSDYPVFTGAEVEAALRTSLPFQTREVEIILRNRGTGLQSAGGERDR